MNLKKENPLVPEYIELQPLEENNKPLDLTID
jgi:hypothetical protein